jgi:hypothetical protein
LLLPLTTEVGGAVLQPALGPLGKGPLAIPESFVMASPSASGPDASLVWVPVEPSLNPAPMPAVAPRPDPELDPEALSPLVALPEPPPLAMPVPPPLEPADAKPELPEWLEPLLPLDAPTFAEPELEVFELPLHSSSDARAMASEVPHTDRQSVFVFVLM